MDLFMDSIKEDFGLHSTAVYRPTTRASFQTGDRISAFDRKKRDDVANDNDNVGVDNVVAAAVPSVKVPKPKTAPTPQAVDPKAAYTQEKRDDIANGNVSINDKNVRLTQKDLIDIQFENITYTASLGFIKKVPKEILHHVNGHFLPGQLIAIMGPSGAGKSTLLDVLSGYRISGVEGAVFINGRGRNLASFRKMSCYITQDDRLQNLLTVQENMRSAANLKLGENMYQYEKDAIIEDILSELGLYECLNTRTDRLSGGQRKRMSIALELISNPQIMFLDEPTTGLDSSTCMSTVHLLKMLASQGRTIICTIHQPSAKLFELFDHVYVLAAGECLYQGSSGNLVKYLEDLNLPCPKYHNPADYVIELACGEYGEDKIEKMVLATDNGKNFQWFTSQNLPSKKELREKHPLTREEHKKRSSGMQETSSLNQMNVLMARGFLKAKRDTVNQCIRLIDPSSGSFTSQEQDRK